MGCVGFIATTPALRSAYLAHQWAKVALFYSGENYAVNAYDKKRQLAHHKFVASGCPVAGGPCRPGLSHLPGP